MSLDDKIRDYFERIRIKFLDFDLADSRECKDDFLQITDKENRRYIEQGLGQDLVWSGNSGKSYYSVMKRKNITRDPPYLAILI